MATPNTCAITRFPIISSLHHSPHFPFLITSSTTTPRFPFTTSTISQPQSFITRRLLMLPSVSGIWEAIAGGGNNNNSRDAVIAIRRGMQLFREGDVAGSVLEFDRARLSLILVKRHVGLLMISDYVLVWYDCGNFIVEMRCVVCCWLLFRSLAKRALALLPQ
ncbi:hypothetical protein AKJ16_DCAP02936 [Drosera capensis]